MESHTCDRCFCREHIPTHQLLKFDDRVQFLCSECWEEFRRWFHWGAGRRASQKQLELF